MGVVVHFLQRGHDSQRRRRGDETTIPTPSANNYYFQIPLPPNIYPKRLTAFFIVYQISQLHEIADIRALRRRFTAVRENAAKPGCAAARGSERCFTQLRHNFHSVQ